MGRNLASQPGPPRCLPVLPPFREVSIVFPFGKVHCGLVFAFILFAPMEMPSEDLAQGLYQAADELAGTDHVSL